MNDLDALLRDTVSDLAAESRPRDLMPEVRARARRIRTVHRTGYAAVLAVAVVLALLVPYLVTRPGPSRPIPIGPPSVSPTAQGDAMVRLPGGWVVTGWTYDGSGNATDARARVLDRRTGRYVTLNYPAAWPAPTGTGVLVEYLDSTSYALLDLATGDVRQVAIPQGATHPEWSPDGTRIVFSRPMSGFGVVDVATATVAEHSVDMDQRYRCNDNCEFTWYPDSRRVVLAVTNTTVPYGEGKPDVQRGLQLFDADTGAAGQLLPVHGIVHSVLDWSPSGRYVAVEGIARVPGTVAGAHAVVIEVATGQLVSVLPADAPWGTVGWVNDQNLIVMSTTGLCLVSRAGTMGTCVLVPDPVPGPSPLFGPG